MSDDSSQVLVPDSFTSLYRSPAGRLLASREQITSRHEFCEDLATALVDQCQAVQFRDGLPEDLVLERVERGLLAAGDTVSPQEARWVLRRTAELLQWPDPGPAATASVND